MLRRVTLPPMRVVTSRIRERFRRVIKQFYHPHGWGQRLPLIVKLLQTAQKAAMIDSSTRKETAMQPAGRRILSLYLLPRSMPVIC